MHNGSEAAAVREAGVNLIGFLSSNIGLGAAARNTLDLLQRKGWPVTVFDMDAGFGRSLHETYFRELCVPTADMLPHGINLWHFNPPEVVFAMNRSTPPFDWNRFNVCVPFWELAVLPDAWRRPLEAMDLILAPTRFIEGVLASQLGNARVRYFRQPLRMPEVPRFDRTALGIPERSFAFVTSFDFGSDLTRKNPVGAVVAFLKSFRGRDDVHLILKWVNQDLDKMTQAAAAGLKRQVEGFPNIHIIDRNMPYPEVLALYRSSDAYVSLHRAEGLGLGLMECMSMGKPVIGTGWSGCMDFMSDTNSCPVGYRLQPVPEDCVYGRSLGGKEALWAEPDLDEAAAAMRNLVEHPDFRRRIGARAEADIHAYNEEALRGAALDDLAAIWKREQDMRARRAPRVFDIPMNAIEDAQVSREELRQRASARPVPIAEPSASWKPVPDVSGQRPSAADAALERLRTSLAAAESRRSKVTAIVSTYNSELFFRGCLQNLVEQTLFAKGRLEVIVVDSGSSQGERVVAEEFRARHPAIVYIRTERETLYAAWNRAVRAATGDYLVNANTDDRNPPHAFERMADALDASPAGLVYGDAVLTEGENETWDSNTASRLWSLPDFSVRQALLDCPFGCVVMWRRSLHGELGYFNPAYRIAGDYDFFLKASMARGAQHLKEVLSLYYESQKNLSYGNQPLVNSEVESFLGASRVETPLQTIYPFLKEDNSLKARLVASMDFAAMLLHPLARLGPKQAIARLAVVLRETGPVPEILNNMAIGLMHMNMASEARDLMMQVLAADPRQAAILGLGTPEGEWVPKRIFQFEHPALKSMPPLVFSADTRTPLRGPVGARGERTAA